MRTEQDGTAEIWKGLLIGLVAGAAGSWAMDRFQAGWNKLSNARKEKPDENSPRRESSSDTKSEEDVATVKTAAALSRFLFDHELTARQKQVAGPAVHYAFGTAIGGLYGALATMKPGTASRGGIPFGAALWLVADEALVPALGLGAAPTKTPLSLQIYALASHLVYGLSTELVRGGIWRAMNRRAFSPADRAVSFVEH